MRLTSCALILTPFVLCATQTTTLEKVKVEAQATPSPLIAQKESATASYVMGQEEINKLSNLSTSDLLKRMPGITISDGKSKDVAMRGLGKGYVKILVDGEELAGGKKDRVFQIDRIPPSAIARIEVSTVPTAAYPSATGGVINIILKDPTALAKSSVKLQTSFTEGLPSYDLFASKEMKIDALKYIANIAFSQGTTPLYQNRQTSTSLTTTQTKFEEKTYATSLTLTPKLNYTIDRYNTLDLFSFLSWGVTSQNDAITNDTTSRHDLDKDRQAMAKSTLKWTHTDAQGGKLIAMLRQHHIYADGSTSFGTTPSSLITTNLEDSGYASEGSYTVPMDEQHLVKGGWLLTKAFHHDRQTKDTLPITNGEGRYNDTTKALFIQDEYAINDRHTVTLGLRGETSTLDVTAPTQQTSTAYSLNPSLHYLFAMTPTDNLRFALAKTTKRPRVDEFLSTISYALGANSLTNPDRSGNPSVRNEAIRSLEAKIEHYTGDKGIISLSLFYRLIENKIENRTSLGSDGRYISRPVNLDDATLWGVEGELKQPFALSVAQCLWSSHATWMHNSVHDLSGEKRHLADTPNLIASTGLDLTKGALTTGLFMTYNGGYDAVTQEGTILATRKPTTQLEWYTTGKYESLTYRLTLKNLLDHPSTLQKTSADQTDMTSTFPKRTVILSLEKRW